MSKQTNQLSFNINSSNDNREKVVLLLNSIDQEGIISSLKSIDQKYKHKILFSKPKNWEKICSIFNQFLVVAVLAKFTPGMYEILLDERYNDVKTKLFRHIASVPHQIYIYEDLLTDKDPDEFQFNSRIASYYSGYLPNVQTRQTVNQQLKEFKLEISPYNTIAEITITAQAFLSQIENDFLFRIYVPKGRLWQKEIDRILSLFTEYLIIQGGRKVRIDQRSTKQGNIYAFYGEDYDDSTLLAEEYKEFTNILDLCLKNPDMAAEILKSKHIDAKKVNQLITQYSKEAKRITLDMKHSYEQKLLSIRQRMESELVDVLPPNSNEILLTQIAESVLKTTSQTGLPFDTNFALSKPTSVANSKPIYLNYKPQFIEGVNGIVAQEIFGDIRYDDKELELMELFKKFSQENAALLISALNELRDNSVPKQDRINSKQKIKSFLVKYSSKIGEFAFNSLLKYFEKKYLEL